MSTTNTDNTPGAICAANASGQGRIFKEWGLFDDRGKRIATMADCGSPERQHATAERLAMAYNQRAALLAVAGAARDALEELKHWHGWRCQTSPGYSTSDGFRICAQRIAALETALKEVQS